MENIVLIILFALYSVTSYHVMKPFATEEWTKEDAKGKICAFLEKSTNMEITAQECVLLFARTLKYFATELIQSNGHKDLDVLLLTFAWRKELASLETLALERVLFIVHQAKN